MLILGVITEYNYNRVILLVLIIIQLLAVFVFKILSDLLKYFE